MNTKQLNIKIGLEIENIAKEEAEKIVSKSLYDAEQLLQAKFDQLVAKFAFQIREAISNKYVIVEKSKLKNEK
jgi:hypothetical protein